MRSAPASLHEAVNAFKRQLILETLARYAGNRSRAASALGIERTSLLRLMRELDIHVEAPPSPRRRAGAVGDA